MTETAVPRSTMPVVELDRIHKSFGEVEVLKGVSLVAHEGEVVVLIGSSGSGKSTLLRCINMLEIPDSGTVRKDAGDDGKDGRHRRPTGAGSVTGRVLHVAPFGAAASCATDARICSCSFS